MSAKVQLTRKPVPYFFRNHPTIKQVAVTWALPYFRSAPGCYVHRVRSGTVHIFKGESRHTSFSFWCGGTGFKSPKKSGELLATVPEHATLCATCEGRAIGSGLFVPPFIDGKAVKYSPRL